jgi:hypothetical protein
LLVASIVLRRADVSEQRGRCDAFAIASRYCARGERPRDGRAAKECDEVAPSDAKSRKQSLPKGSVVRHSKISPPMTLWVICD